MKNLMISCSEQEYRNLTDSGGFPIISYSAIAKYERDGFDGYVHMQDSEETDSLIFGSAVDTLLTEGELAFQRKFKIITNTFTGKTKEVLDFVIDTIINGNTFNLSSESYIKIFEEAFEATNFYTNRSLPSKLSMFFDNGNVKHEFMEYIVSKAGQECKVISESTYDEVIKTVNTLKYDPYVGRVFNTNLEHYYQAKFTTTMYGVQYKVMFDLLVIDNNNKKIIPVDLKTSSKPEYDFLESLLKWRYDIQARLYCRVINEIVQHSSKYAGYIVEPMKFIVINKHSLNPLVFEFDESFEVGNLTYGDLILRDPFDIGYELNRLIHTKATLPIGIIKNGVNSLKRLLLNR